MDLVILNLGQMARATPKLAPRPKYRSTPTGGQQAMTNLMCINSSTQHTFNDTRARTHDTPTMSSLP
ncbi:hypothetical protein TNCV_860871 [Trichonephila clavipes]|nr:hypothetical protein TNCV_860871 [Trichonephila clavipes]